MKIVAFAASNSQASINKALITFATSLVPDAEVEILDLNDYELPLFSMEREAELGQPLLAQTFYRKLGEADAIFISFAEHNGSYSAAFKNIFDWCSRIDQKVYQNKPMVMLATSPGPGGAKTVLGAAVNSAPYFAGDVKASLSVPSFYDNFDMVKGELVNDELRAELAETVAAIV